MSGNRIAAIPSVRIARNPLLTADFALLMLAQASFGYAYSGFFLLPKFLVATLGAGPGEVGLAMAVYGVTAIVSMPAMGVAVDRFGRRDFLTAGALAMALACVGFVAVREMGGVLYALRALQGLGFAMAFVAGITLAVDGAPPERLGQSIALVGLATLSMNAVGPAVMEHVADRAGWPWGFVVAAGAALGAAVLSRFVRDDGRVPPPTGPGPGLWEILRDPAQLRIAVVVMLAGTGFGAMITFHQPFALSLGMRHVRGFFVAYAAAAIVVRVGFGALIDGIGWRRVSLAALVLYGVVVAAMASLGTLGAAGLALLGAGLGIAHGLFYPSLNALAVAGCGRDERGKVMAIFQAAFTIGFAGGNYPLGILAERAGYPAVFIAAGLCAFLGLGVLFASPEGRRDAQEPVAPGAAVGACNARRAARRASSGGCE